MMNNTYTNPRREAVRKAALIAEGKRAREEWEAHSREALRVKAERAAIAADVRSQREMVVASLLA